MKILLVDIDSSWFSIPLLTEFARWVDYHHKAKLKRLGLLGSFKTFLKHERKKLLKNHAKKNRNPYMLTLTNW